MKVLVKLVNNCSCIAGYLQGKIIHKLVHSNFSREKNLMNCQEHLVIYVCFGKHLEGKIIKNGY